MTEKVQNEKKATAEDEENMTSTDKKQASLDAAAAVVAISSVNEKDEVFASSSEDLGNKTPSGSSSETNSSSESDHNEQSKYRSSQNLTLLDAREYQMIRRHMVNGNSLLENIEDGAEPLDDDSDLKTEPYLEAFERAKERLKVQKKLYWIMGSQLMKTIYVQYLTVDELKGHSICAQVLCGWYECLKFWEAHFWCWRPIEGRRKRWH